MQFDFNAVNSQKKLRRKCNAQKRREENTMKKIKQLLNQLSADKAEKGKEWKGYEVYVPVYSQPALVGLPLVILVKGNEQRISTPEESLEYLAYCHE